MSPVIRWQQRFSNFLNAFSQLEMAVDLTKQRSLSELEKQGLIQAFEFTHELAWNILKDYLSYQGVFDLIGSRDTSREAFQRQLISQGEDWMEMIKSRNLSSHTYNKKIADEIIQLIISRYYKCFSEFKNKMQTLVSP
ncbi:MAG: nucleotidyltransferase substrate binding protein [Oligoflexales bacterium]|nr:nucleotidyltransferase substrate binding protein [Oligoflexales bacterium]